MSHIRTKIKLVFLPLLFLSIAFIIVYGLLYWLFYIQLGVNTLKEDLVHYWIPGGLAFTSVILLIRPRVHILKLDMNDGRIRTLYYLVAAAVLAVPTIFIANFLDTATGKLTTLDTINEITQKPATKYYQVRQYALDKENAGIQTSRSYSGKHNEYINYDIYLAIPIVTNLYDTTQPVSVFLSKKYHERVSSKISDELQKIKWETFWDESFKSFDREIISFTYLERMGNNETRDNVMLAASDCVRYNLKEPFVILESKSESFKNRNGNSLNYAFLSLGIGCLVWLVMIIIPGIHSGKVKRIAKQNGFSVKKQLESAYEAVKPRKGFAATPILVALNILVFVVMVFKGFGVVSFYSRDLIPLGALYEPAVQKGEWWRLITSMFLHGGLMHLVMNMVSLCLAGLFLENFIGTKKFVLGYLISGIVAAIVSMWWHDKPVVAVGASGAIFGLYGMLLSLIVSKVFDSSLNKVLLTLLGFTAGYSLLMGFMSEGIDNSAHLGGLVAGFVIGFFFVRAFKRKIG